MNNVLHLLLNKYYKDDACVVTLLKYVPILATIPNCKGILPIEMACMNNLSNTIILALSLLDLPIDINNTHIIHENNDVIYGASWYFLTCDSNDDYINIVKEILILCTYYQIRELCFMRGPIVRNNKKRFTFVNGDIV